MYPTKRTMEYMNEMNRLFPRNSADDLFFSPLSPISSQSVPRSSSSTDTSPEAFPATQLYQNDQQTDPNFSLFSLNEHYDYALLNTQQTPTFEYQATPYTAKRPITGRKLNTEYLTTDNDDNSMYELFPAQKSFQLTRHQNAHAPDAMNMGRMTDQSPRMTDLSPIMKDLSPRMTDMSPRMSDMSSRMQDLSRQNLSPRMSDFWPAQTVTSNQADLSPRLNSSMTYASPKRPEMSLMTSMSNLKVSPSRSDTQSTSNLGSNLPEMSPKRPPIYPQFKEPIALGFQPNTPNKMCTFCRKNGETPLVYMTHAVKEKIGNRTVVTCPILRSHVCSACGSSGDKAHTISYCPVLRSGNNGQPLQSTTITLKNTRVKSNGRRRY